MTALAGIRDRVEQRLNDTGNSIWGTDWVDEGIRQALAEYSMSIPRGLNTTVTLSADGREVDISSISGLLYVERVWTPYTASDPEYPPNWRKFEHWIDAQVVYFPDSDEPQNGDVVRLFYGAAHTIQNLDSATATTLRSIDESLLITGAAGHAAVSRALDLQEQVTLGRAVAVSIERWGIARLDEFQRELTRRVAQLAMRGNSRVVLPKVDRHHRGSDWS